MERQNVLKWENLDLRVETKHTEGHRVIKGQGKPCPAHRGIPDPRAEIDNSLLLPSLKQLTPPSKACRDGRDMRGHTLLHSRLVPWCWSLEWQDQGVGSLEWLGLEEEDTGVSTLVKDTTELSGVFVPRKHTARQLSPQRHQIPPWGTPAQKSSPQNREACHSFWASLLLCIVLTVWQTQGAQLPCHPARQAWQSDFQHYQVLQVPSQASSSNSWADTAQLSSHLLCLEILVLGLSPCPPRYFPPSSSSCSSRHPAPTYLVPLIGVFVPFRNNLLSRLQPAEQATIFKKQIKGFTVGYFCFVAKGWFQIHYLVQPGLKLLIPLPQ